MDSMEEPFPLQSSPTRPGKDIQALCTQCCLPVISATGTARGCFLMNIPHATLSLGIASQEHSLTH